MSFATSHAAQTYAKVGLETSVVTASPHQLILMLYDGALLAIAKASNAIQQKQVAEKGQAISQAIDIISNGLAASLDFSAADELANRLAALYDYMCRRLLHANLHDDQAALNEVTSLLGEIKSAWEEIADDPAVLAHQKNKVAA
ncbi:MAG: flagellar export chaperone FliS [Rugosibacter sp.]|nr:MAG: flagellar export chaperone FliS [Rugosibacter sp.]TBR09601.1 MAG: flagellar export chaperone FliS [Rugosibacter sp.]